MSSFLAVFRVPVFELQWPHKPKPLNRRVKSNVGIKNRNYNGFYDKTELNMGITFVFLVPLVLKAVLEAARQKQMRYCTYT